MTLMTTLQKTTYCWVTAFSSARIPRLITRTLEPIQGIRRHPSLVLSSLSSVNKLLLSRRDHCTMAGGLVP